MHPTGMSILLVRISFIWIPDATIGVATSAMQLPRHCPKYNQAQLGMDIVAWQYMVCLERFDLLARLIGNLKGFLLTDQVQS